MPQLDFAYYISQWCWGLISFALVYTLVVKSLTICLSHILSKRIEVINANLQLAQQLNNKAEILLSEYNKKISAATMQSTQAIKEIHSQLKQANFAKIAELNILLSRKEAEYILHLRNEMHSIVKDIANKYNAPISSFIQKNFDNII